VAEPPGEGELQARATEATWRAPVPTAKTPAITSGRPAERIGNGGPVPIVEIRNSFEDDEPALVSLQFYWPDQRPSYG
jgi:hypothetical protein